MTDRIFVTCASYVLGRILGQEQAAAQMSAQLKFLATTVGELSSAGIGQEPAGILPAMRTITELTKVCEAVVRCDGGCSDVAKYRSRMLHAFLQSDCSAWMSIDDDVEASPETLRDLLLATRSLKPTIAVAPCLLRDGRTVNVRWPAVYVEERLPSGALMRQCDAAGFGLVMMNRAAAEIVARKAFRFIDDDGAEKVAAFFPIVVETVMRPSSAPPFVESVPRDDNDRWMGEDVSFFMRAKNAGVERWALLSGATRHAGYTLEFAKLV